MSEGDRFDDPQRVAINRVYTRKGDGGSTTLVGGQRVAKHDLRIECYGTVDELNAFVGAARQTALEAAAGEHREVELDRLARVLQRVQHQLFNLGAILATLPEDVHPRQPRVTVDDVAWLEAEMDRCNAKLEPLRSFVLPGGSRLNTDLHVCRTVCRRAERVLTNLIEHAQVEPEALAYLNRLSDAFFVWSRWVQLELQVAEQLWEPNRASENIDCAE
jgi:cob(I)alamin adenosyltransferase